MHFLILVAIILFSMYITSAYFYMLKKHTY